MRNLKSTFFRRSNNSDPYHEFEETGARGEKIKLLFKSKPSPKSLFSPLRRADGSFPATTRSSSSGDQSDDYYASYHGFDERDDVAALSHDFEDSSRQLKMEHQPFSHDLFESAKQSIRQINAGEQALPPISEGARKTKSLEGDNLFGEFESPDVLPLPQYESFRTVEDDILVDIQDSSFWSNNWEPPEPEFPPPPSVSTLSGEDPETLATQSISAEEESSKLFTDDDASISSSATEKRDNSSGLFPISECSQSEAPNGIPSKPKSPTLVKPAADSDSDLQALQRELEARLDVIHTLKGVIMKQGHVITAQKKTMKKHECKLAESRSVIKCLYRQHMQFKGDISHLELEAELHEARAMWSKQELFTVRTELDDVKKAGFKHNKLERKDRKGCHGHDLLRNENSKDTTSLSHNETSSTAESSADDSGSKEENKKRKIMHIENEPVVSEKPLSRKVADAFEFDEDSTDNTLVFGVSSNESSGWT